MYVKDRIIDVMLFHPKLLSMLSIRKFISSGLIISFIGFLIFLTPIFYQTYQFYYTHQVIFPPPVKSAEHTEVYLIGTRHLPTNQYNRDTVYRHLEKIQPDLILLELYASFFQGDRLKSKYTYVMRFYPFLRKYWNLEMLAATKYAKYHNEVRLAHFEWEGKRTGNQRSEK